MTEYLWDIVAWEGEFRAPGAPPTSPSEPPPSSPPAESPPTRPTPPNQERPGNAPQPSGAIWFDMRAGGNADLQRMGSFAEVAQLIGEGWYTGRLGLTTNLDGQGTRAILAAYPNTAVDAGAELILRLGRYLGGQDAPRQLCIAWKMRLGRTATGEGVADGHPAIGAVGAFDPFNEVDAGVDNAGMKRIRVLRRLPDGGEGGDYAFDILWSGRGDGTGWQHVAANMQPFYPPHGFNIHEPDSEAGWFKPEAQVGRDLHYTLCFRASSGLGVRDGVISVWVDGTRLLHAADLDLSPYGVDRFQFPIGMREPQVDMTEYWWDIVAWTPQG